MKKLIIFLLPLIMAGCTVTPQQKAEKAIKAYMLQNLDNPKEYEPVEFGQIDTVFSDFDYILDKKYKEYRDAKDEYEDYQGYIKDGFDVLAEMNKKDAMKAKRRMDSLQNYADSLEAAFVPRPLYMSIYHEYRAENKFGAIVKESHLFRVNFDYTVRVLF